MLWRQRWGVPLVSLPGFLMSQTLLYLEGNCRVGVELRPEATWVLAVPRLSWG